MDFKVFDVQIEGISPIIFHNLRLANPLGEYAKKIKEITAKKKKTDAELIKLQELEFLGSLYYNDEIGVYIPNQFPPRLYNGQLSTPKIRIIANCKIAPATAIYINALTHLIIFTL